MPKLDGKKFAYTEKGMKAYRRALKREVNTRPARKPYRRKGMA